MKKKSYTVAVDVGGTNVKFGLVSSNGTIIARAHLPTDQYKSGKNLLIAAIARTIKDLCATQKVSLKDVKGVGMGLPGLIDFARGSVVVLPNVPGWVNVPLKKILERHLGVAVFIDNDVNVIALGEWKFGAGRGYDHMIEITLGTGVGGGLILDGRLYRGYGFAAGEIGHIPLDDSGPACGCGARGCLETFIGNRRIQAQAAKIFHKPDIHPPDIKKMALQGDKRAIAFWNRFGQTLGRGLVGIVNVLNPQAIILGGGVSNNFSMFQKAMLHELKTRCMTVQAKNIKILRSTLGDDAGLIGAHVLVEESLKS